jgi:putative transcriptional regulator
MKCSSCGSSMTAKKETKYHYIESGLSRVYLNGVITHKCTNKDCGEEDLEIPNILELHQLLAEAIAKQGAKLQPEEIKFLRSHLGFSGSDFARKIGTTLETVSRWENGKRLMGDGFERLLRLMVLTNKEAFTDYGLLEEVAQKASKTPIKRTLKSDDSHWRELETA